jgi:hypothetical protein
MGHSIKNGTLDDYWEATDAFCRRCYGFSVSEIANFPLHEYFRVGHTALEAAHAAARFRAGAGK